MTDDELDGLARLVKPLEWFPQQDSYLLTRTRWRDIALSRFEYSIFSDMSLMGCMDDTNNPYESVGAAKAAAQADYARRILSALNLDALRSPPADVGEAIDADDIQQAMSDVFSEGGSVRDAAVYVKACIDRALAETTKGDDPSTET